jgi:hypothetical protein
MAVKTTFACGHVEIEGGDLADPCAVYQEASGLMEYRNDSGICMTCREPEKYKFMTEWKDTQP